MTQPEVNLKDLQARFFSTGSEFLNALLQGLNSFGEFGGHVIPGFSLITKYGTALLSKAGREFTNWWKRRGARTFADIDELSQDALLRRLPGYFAADLMDALAHRRPPRLVIMFDTYEALWRSHGLKDGPGALRIDDWVRQLVADAPGVMFVIAGRDKLRWQEIDIDAHWDRVIDERALDGLTRSDADTLLRKWKVAEPAIRERMINGAYSHELGEIDTSDNTTEAYLPFYLELQAKTYGNIKVTGDTPKPENFGGDQPKILARFLEHLDSETDKLLRVASYLYALDPNRLDMLSDKFLGGRANADWSRLYSRSLVSDEKDGQRLLHNLLRKALQEREQRERPALYRDIHDALFTWFEDRGGSSELNTVTQEQERALLSAIRHKSRVDERAAVLWANSQMSRLDQAGRWLTLEEICQLVLPFAQRAFGAEDPSTAAILSWQASAASSNGRYDDAEALFRRALHIEENTPDHQHSTANTLHNLARVYNNTERHAKAEELFKQALAIKEEVLHPEDLSTATTLHELARVYRDTERYTKAEELFERVLAIEQKTLGAEHRSTATTLRSLAGVYRDTRRYAKAEDLLRQVREIEKQALDPDHPATAATLHDLARVYRDTGRYTEAEDLFMQALEIEKKTLGPQHPTTATTLVSLADVYHDTGRYTDAAKLFEQALAVKKSTLGPDHLVTTRTLASLADVYRDMGRYVDAENLFKQVRAIEKKTLDPEHPSIAATLHGLAGVYSDTKRYTESETLFEQALKIDEKNHGLQHSSTAAVLHGLAWVYADTGRHADAERLFKQVREIEESTLSPDHPSTATTLASLACVYRDAGRFTESTALLEQAWQTLSAKLSPHHPKVATLLVQRGMLNILCGEKKQASDDFTKALAIFKAAGVLPGYRWARDGLEKLRQIG
jgi:tetratricopeptide (TPR) repeat protein